LEFLTLWKLNAIFIRTFNIDTQFYRNYLPFRLVLYSDLKKKLSTDLLHFIEYILGSFFIDD